MTFNSQFEEYTADTPQQEVIQILHQVITKQLDPHHAGQLLHALPITNSDLSRVLHYLNEQYISVREGRADPEAVKIAYLTLYHRIKSAAHPFLLSIMSNRIGSLSCLAGKNNEGIIWLEQSVEQGKGIGELFQSENLGNLGNAYRNVGRLKDAQRVYKQAIALAEAQQLVPVSQFEGPKSLLNHLNNLALVYGDLDDWVAQNRTLRKALRIAKAIQSEWHIAAIATTLGTLYRDRGDKEGALQYYQQALSIAERQGNERLKASLLVNLGIVCRELGRLEEALRYLDQGLKLAEWLGLKPVLTNGLVSMGNLCVDMQQLATAQQCFERAVEVGRQQEEPLCLLKALTICAEFYERQILDVQREYTLLQEAAEVGESLRRQITRPDIGEDIYRDLSKAYTRLAYLSINARRLDEAFSWTERMRAALLIHELLSRRHEEWKTDLEKANSLYAHQHLALTEILDDLKRLGPHAVLISYFVTEDQVHIFVLRSNEEYVRYQVRQLKAEQLAVIRENFTREVERYHKDVGIGETWLELGQYILDPIVQYLQPEDVLFIVPHGGLRNLPLHALKVGKSRLIERWPVAYLPAASALAALTDLAPTAPKTPVVIGVHHTEEALAVADILRAEKHLIGESVAKEAVLDALQKGDLIHISANGFASQRQPDRSGWLLQSSWEVERYLEVAKKPDFALLPDEFADREKYEQLAQDAIISIADLESLHLHAMMVCASTCESGLVYTNIAEDPIGIIRSFLVGGVRNVVTALWKVDPKATQKLMEAYYQQLTHSPAGWGYKPQALRLAMLDIMREYPHPYFWAAFFLVGGADAGVAESQKGEEEC